MLTSIFSTVAVSGIKMGPFDLFSARATHGNLNGALHQSHDQLALVFSGSAHVRLRIGGGTGRFGSGRNRLVVQAFSAECRLGLGRADLCQSDAAQSNGGVAADVARQSKLHGSTGAWIHGSAPLECQIG